MTTDTTNLRATLEAARDRIAGKYVAAKAKIEAAATEAKVAQDALTAANERKHEAENEIVAGQKDNRRIEHLLAGKCAEIVRTGQRFYRTDAFCEKPAKVKCPSCGCQFCGVHGRAITHGFVHNCNAWRIDMERFEKAAPQPEEEDICDPDCRIVKHDHDPGAMLESETVQ